MTAELIERPSRSMTLPLPDVRVVRGTSALLKAMRPHQWVKQVFVGAAPLVGGVLTHASAWPQIFVAVVAFSLAASAGYLHNDIGDVEADRAHPRKRFRPIASGRLPIPLARAASFGLFFLAIALASLSSVQLAAVVATYSVLTVSYTSFLKHIPTVDVFALSACFTIRAIGGAVAVHIPVTIWFFVVATAAALFLALGKREAELKAVLEAGPEAKSSRASLQGYSLRYVQTLRALSLTTLIGAYVAWALVRGEGLTGGHIPFFTISIAPFLVVMTRYTQRIANGEGEDPQEIIRDDRTMLVAGAVCALLVGLGAYAG